MQIDPNHRRIKHVDNLRRLLPEKDVLVVGKGPSSQRWKPEYAAEFVTVGINHASERFGCTIAHFTDYEMFTDVRELSPFVIVSGAMNWRSRSEPLLNFVKHDYRLKELIDQRRLYSYDVKSNEIETELFGKDPLEFKFASGVLLTQVCIRWSLSKMFTIGIDGGDKYAPEFESNKGNGRFLDNQIQRMNQLAQGKIEIVRL